MSNLFYNNVYEVKKKPDNLSLSTDPPESIELSEIVELRRMLKDEEFVRLNSVLDEFQNIFEKDQTREYKLYDAYQTFYFTLPSYEDSFKKWIDRSPGKYQPYLAMAEYYYARGWESRGYKWRKDTSEQQFDEIYVKCNQGLKQSVRTRKQRSLQKI